MSSPFPVVVYSVTENDLGIPRTIVLFRLVREVGEVAALDGEPGFVSTVHSSAHLSVSITVTTTPLGFSQEHIGKGRNLVTHETVSPFHTLACDLSDEDALGRHSGDLKEVDVGLIVSPRHTEDRADLDRIRSGCIIHCGYSVEDNL